MNLRLDTLANMVDSGSRVADIGTDHAYLPIALIKDKKINYAIASDIAQGPLQNAKDDIFRFGLNDKIETRLGAGLDTIISDDNINTVVIAGMGGKMIIQILDNALKSGFLFETLILEPNVSEAEVRTWLMNHKYKITAEKLIFESGHSYELIKAKLTDKIKELSKKAIFFGPIILQDKNNNPVFYQKWQKQLAYFNKLLVNLNKAKQKDIVRINRMHGYIKLIEGELND